MLSSRQKEEREARKQRILDGALRVFQREGLEGATMGEIAHQAGFGKATLYYYFASKEEVFCAIMEKGWEPLWEGIESVIHNDAGPRETFIEIIEKIVEITLKERNLYRFLFSAPKAVTNLPESHQPWKKYQNRIYGVLTGLLEDGMAKGEFPKVDPQLLLRAVGGLFHGLMFLGNGQEKFRKKDIDELISKFLATPGPVEGEHN
ncbi:MAG: TetR/AcrR family transcriptional regulator [Candidatus Neomarinimicrobiota bacterium]